MASSKGKSRMKVPKRIGGVKIPKPIRKGPVGDFLNSSGGQVLVAEALLIAGSTWLAKRSDSDSSVASMLRHPVDQLKEAGRGTAATASQTGEAIGDTRRRLATAFGAALQAFRESMDQDEDFQHASDLTRRDDSMASMSDDLEDGLDGDDNDEGVAKKKRAGRNRPLVSPPPVDAPLTQAPPAQT